MQLIVLAHRGEAQSLLREEKFKSLAITGLDLYKNEKAYLLLTGEGLQAATEMTSFVLGKFEDKISSVLNIGIAGSLLETVPQDSFVSIRTVYGESLKQKPAFKSFSSADQSAQADCITAADRVLSDEYAKALRPFATVVDRELWAIASTASRFNKPFYAYKLISDLAGSRTNCFDLSHRAEYFANKIAAFYADLSLAEAREAKTEQVIPESLKDDFYFTKAQERSFKKLMESLSKRASANNENSSIEAILAQLPLRSLREKEILPKERTQELLEDLRNLLNPFQKIVRQKLNTQVKSLQEAHCELKFDPTFEKDQMQLSINIEHQSHIEKLRSALTDFDYNEIKKTINGNLGD